MLSLLANNDPSLVGVGLEPCACDLRSAVERQNRPCDSLERAALNELVAQLVEQRPFKAWVLGSSPSELTTPPGRKLFRFWIGFQASPALRLWARSALLRRRAGAGRRPRG